MNTINYQGLDIKTECKYFWIHLGPTISVKENKQRSVYELTYTQGCTTDSISKVLGIPVIGSSRVLSEMSGPEKFIETKITLNGLEFLKKTYDQHTIKMVIVGDSESRILQTYDYTTFVISEKDYNNPEFIKFIINSGNLKYICPIINKKICSGWEFRNFPRIIINKKSLVLESESKIVHSLRSKYDNYKIRSIDYQDQFITEIRKRLNDYGIELVRINREKTLSNTSYITYRFSQTPVNYNHPRYYDDDENVLSHKVPVEFEFHCDNTQMFFDFKNKYQNVNLLSNFCEMTTLDKYGELWTSAIKWGKLGEDFSHTYESDNNSNFSLTCQFSCELYFYEVYDDYYGFIKEIIIELEHDNI